MSNDLKPDGIGTLIRECRKERRMSLEQLAAKLGWDVGRLSKYETGKLKLTSENADTIASALGMRPEELALRWLKAKYPSLSEHQPRIAAILDKLVEAVGTLPPDKP